MLNTSQPKQKIHGLEDPYEQFPSKTDDDPWAILLKPEMEADKNQCDAWKEEVQNLLIFAGLFSAVVTAFVIESYKFLQPDPNDNIIDLLRQIANSANSTAPLSITATAFVQTSSSIRINVLWFLSLILSLTTVLVGTIALQWIREHQSYPGFSAKETLAALHMRSDSLKAWHVRRLFAALPLLLQSALVLFLVGLIDFTLPLGVKLSAPIAFLIGLILLFLTATTILPATQPFFLLSGNFSLRTVPTPCAFKSPQSQVFRTLVRFFLRLSSSPYYRKGDRINILPPPHRHLFPFIYTISHHNTWPDLDIQWLSLRDAWHHGICDNGPDLYDHREEWELAFPLHDITQSLAKIRVEATSAKHTDEFLRAAYQCFQEISVGLWSNLQLNGQQIDRANMYFETLLRSRDKDPAPYLTLSRRGGPYKYGNLPEDSEYITQHKTFFCRNQTLVFLTEILVHQTSPSLDRYRLEIMLRMMQHLLQSGTNLLTMANVHPLSLAFHLFSNQHQKVSHADYVSLLSTIFANVASKRAEDINPLYTHVWMPFILNDLANGMILFLDASSETDVENGSGANQGKAPTAQRLYLHTIGEEYERTFSSAAAHLANEISANTEESTPSILFYISAILLQCFFRRVRENLDDNIPGGQTSSFGQGLTILLNTLATLRRRKTYKPSLLYERRLEGREIIRAASSDSTKELFSLEYRFTERWWISLFDFYDCEGNGEPGGLVRQSPVSVPYVDEGSGLAEGSP